MGKRLHQSHCASNKWRRLRCSRRDCIGALSEGTVNIQTGRNDGDVGPEGREWGHDAHMIDRAYGDHARQRAWVIALGRTIIPAGRDDSHVLAQRVANNVLMWQPTPE